MKFSKIQRYILSVLSGILMVVSFPFSGSLTPLVFISWIPLLLIENEIASKNYRSRKLLVHSFITFIIYNLGTTWWVSNSTLEGSLMAFGLNTIFMVILFQLFHSVKKLQGVSVGYLSLVFFWVAFEYLHYQWELSWPWLHLGNYFSIRPEWVQWYEFTGVYGGTIWVLALNILGLLILKRRWINKDFGRKSDQLIAIGSAVFILPFTLSLWMYFSYEETINPVNVVIVQPNIDPYNEKFDSSTRSQLEKLTSYASAAIDSTTDFVIAPETALPEAFYEEDVQSVGSVNFLIQQKKEWQLPNLIIGASTAKYFEKKNSRASRKMDGGPGYIEYYNTSMLINSANKTEFIHKSLLVPGAEIIPFSETFPFLETLALNSGGTSGSLGIEKEPQVFQTNVGKIAPLICYESVSGNLLAQQVKKGAEICFVITNDGWWGNTPGYKQHASFSRLRAIETRRYVARSANTGISGIINQRGDVISSTPYWEPAVIKGTLQRNSTLTFYAKHGDYLGRAFALMSIILLLINAYKRIKSLFAA
ncbi:MAG: apolipoprotein N-acyltransferase [Bacteroidota bacterium]